MVSLFEARVTLNGEQIVDYLALARGKAYKTVYRLRPGDILLTGAGYSEGRVLGSEGRSKGKEE
jgi:siroheme synthase